MNDIADLEDFGKRWVTAEIAGDVTALGALATACAPSYLWAPSRRLSERRSLCASPARPLLVSALTSLSQSERSPAPTDARQRPWTQLGLHLLAASSIHRAPNRRFDRLSPDRDPAVGAGRFVHGVYDLLDLPTFAEVRPSWSVGHDGVD
jgi:hypothetical protein